jgi:two-component system phosphate regulon sensor histidine kinase PhoR
LKTYRPGCTICNSQFSILNSKMRVHRLASNVAFRAAVAAVVLMLVLLATGASWPWALAGAAVLGGVVYAVVRRVLGTRLAAMRARLRRLRRFEFDAPAGDSAARAERRGADELDELLEETHRTGQVLADEMRELRKMENYRREFIGNVSHELKTPIFSIQGFSETLLDGALEDESVRRSFIEKIARNAGRLRHLARDLAEIARIETGELKMTKTAIAMRPLVREVVESLEPVAAEQGVSLRERLSEDLPRVQGDRERLRQVLTNLVDNAVKYNEEGGSVDVAARRTPDGAVKTYVVDDGLGVAPEHVERLTERFYRVDQSRSREQGGTGLGLAIVKHILGAHGSELTVSSSLGRGSMFGFTLPAAPERGASTGRERGDERDNERGANGEVRSKNGGRERHEQQQGAA